MKSTNVLTLSHAGALRNQFTMSGRYFALYPALGLGVLVSLRSSPNASFDTDPFGSEPSQLEFALSKVAGVTILKNSDESVSLPAGLDAAKPVIALSSI